MAGKKRRREGDTRLRKTLVAAGTVLLTAVIVTFLPVALPRVFGLAVYNVTTGSMEPQIPVGSAVYVKAIDPVDLETGDVVAYARSTAGGQGMTVVHRVQGNDPKACELVTKGDANAAADPLTVPYHEVQGEVVAQVPVLGTLASVYASLWGKFCALGIAASGLALCFLGYCV